MTDREGVQPPPSDRSLFEWFSSSDCTPVAPEWVPGASALERQRLAALGGLVGALLAAEESDLPIEFSAPSLQSWITSGPVPPEEVILEAKKLLSSEREVGLARLYTELVAPSSRRRLGTFFTAPAEVDWMIDRWSASQPDPASIIDVGAGVGIFTTSAAKRWPRSQVWAVDVNPITLGLLALRVHEQFRVRGDYADGPGIRVILEDYMSWIQRRWSDLPMGRLVLGNPPYTRLQLLPQEERTRLGAAAGGLCGSRASLSALITAATLRVLGVNDGLCLLLPVQWLESDYARPLREHLWQLTHRRIELHLFASELFADAQVDAVALLVGVQCPEPQPLVLSRDSGRSRRVARSGASPGSWRGLFEQPVASNRSSITSRLRDFATVKRGVATGDNAFFVISERDRLATKVARSVLRPLIRRLRELPDVVDEAAVAELDEAERHWLLVASQEHALRLKGLAQYIADGAQAGVSERELCKRRRPIWYDLSSEVFVPDVVVGPMSKKRFRLVENQLGGIVTNNLYGLIWRPETATDQRIEIVRWLRSEAGQAVLTASARTQGSGLLKIEPRALNQIELPSSFRSPADTLL